VANPLAQYAQISQLQSAQNQNALAQYQLSAAQRADEQQNKLYEAVQQPGFNLDFASAIKYGAPGIAAFKAQTEAEAAGLTRTKAQGEINKQNVDILDSKLKQSRAFLDTLNPADPNAPQQYLQWHQANHADPVIGPALKARGVSVDQSRAQIEAAIAKGPQAFADLINGSKLGTEKFMELNKPTTQVIDQSGQSQMFQTPGLGGTPRSVGTFADVPLPANVEEQKGRLAKLGAAQTITNVNAFAPASVEAQKQFVQAAADERKVLRNAPDTLTNIDAAIKLIPTASTFMGKGGEPLLAAASFLNNRLGFGISTQGVTDATVLRTRLFEGILDNLKKLDSQPSQEQQRVLSEALGNLGTDPAALEQILNRIGETVRSRVDRFNTDVTDAETRGVKFPFTPQIKLPAPKFAPGAAAAQIPGQGPAPAPAPAIPPAAINLLKSGKGTDAQFDAIFGAGAAKRARGGS
jgi:hypothetical protein